MKTIAHNSYTLSANFFLGFMLTGNKIITLLYRALPPEMLVLYKPNFSFLSDRTAVDPGQTPCLLLAAEGACWL